MLGANPFPTAAHYLLAPSPSVRGVVAQFYLQHMAGRRIVGVHLRTVEYMTLREQEFPHPPSMFPHKTSRTSQLALGRACAKIAVRKSAGEQLWRCHCKSMTHAHDSSLHQAQEIALRCASFLAPGGASSVLVASDTSAGMQLASKVSWPMLASEPLLPDATRVTGV
jgi:hypothetical protein